MKVSQYAWRIPPRRGRKTSRACYGVGQAWLGYGWTVLGFAECLGVLVVARGIEDVKGASGSGDFGGLFGAKWSPYTKAPQSCVQPDSFTLGRNMIWAAVGAHRMAQLFIFCFGSVIYCY